MPETTTFEHDLFWKLLKIRGVLIVVNAFKLFLQVCRKKMSVWGGYGNCAFLYCNIDFFSRVFGTNYDAATNGRFGMDCLRIVRQ